MENYRSSGGCSVWLLWFSMGILLLLRSAKAENKSEPLKNVLLSPFWQWRSAYECMLLNAGRCSEKHILKLDGMITISDGEVAEYCKPGGCKEHTIDTLHCIHMAKRDFWFANKAPVQYINDIITDGCNKSTIGFTTANYSSSALKVYQKTYVSLISSLLTLVFLAIFNK